MRIAFIVGQFPVISETFILNQVAGLLDRGYEVDIFADSPGDWVRAHAIVDQYNLAARTYYFKAVPDSLLLRLWQALWLLPLRFRQTPLKTLRALNILRYKEQATSLWLLYSLLPQLKQAHGQACDQAYDIIHCQFGTSSFRARAFQVLHAPQAKLLTIFRGHDISSFVMYKGRNVYDSLFRTGDYFLANCEFFKQRAIALGCPPDRIRVHGSGLDLAKFPFQLRQPASGPIQLATVGRLVDKKGITYAIEALAALLNPASPHYFASAPLKYWIIGDGPLRAELEAQTEQLGLSEVVQFMGARSQEDIVETLSSCHLFLAPSVTADNGDQDAPTNVLKEAMALGLPVVSTEHGGIPELVRSGQSGYLVPERDSDAMAQKLKLLLTHPQDWPELGRAGRRAIEQQYDLEWLNDRLVALYDQLLSSDDVLSRQEFAIAARS